jgi:hypothetical protein
VTITLSLADWMDRALTRQCAASTAIFTRNRPT